ncbi:uncharacterized protein LOC127243533 isoform X2 [Andrographis paniculata]|nr:uncharacterized protein LOC127243533 isoform X2 [Andrographis paniculata]XP_051119570.1 uncharacterized protein LOC127243533 isoform X2 [Andrographis paniculata]XP_051119571.1 uncharacterized protein LOC127243533 isoform X2 [Andrographis paniculata]XP_051119572.1 uncharacterized protein LOC127243533 isoform X2 [Andrographis paniculata]
MVLHPFQAQIVVMFLTIFGSSYGRAGFVEKYISQSYFEKYDSLIDSKFSQFIAEEIPLGLCIVRRDGNCITPTLSTLHRDVIGEGSHRRLSSSITFKFQPKVEPDLTGQSCKLIVIERLPSGVFADPFELQHLIQRGVFADAAVFGDTNLELPSFRSNQSVVEIHMNIASKESQLGLNLEVPLHARYQPLGDEGYSRVEFGKPDWVMCCSPEGNVSCALMLADRISESRVTWEIPCGMKKHVGVVSSVTFGFAIMAALLIILASVCYSDNNNFLLSQD